MPIHEAIRYWAECDECTWVSYPFYFKHEAEEELNNHLWVKH